jgi:DNA-binding MarR family transcriptional regulator
MQKMFKYGQKPVSSSDPAEQALLELERTTDHMRREIHLMLRASGLTSTQFNALRILQSSAPGGLTCSALGSRLISTDPDITRLLDRLAKQGLVRRHRDARDRRVVLTEITEDGSALLASITPGLDAHVRELFSHMAPQRMEQLIELLGEVLQSARVKERGGNVEELPQEPVVQVPRAG